MTISWSNHLSSANLNCFNQKRFLSKLLKGLVYTLIWHGRELQLPFTFADSLNTAWEVAIPYETRRHRFGIYRPCCIAATGLEGGTTRQGAGLVTDLAAPLPGMPLVLDPHDIYAADRPGELSPTVKDYPSRIYVPNSGSNTVDVIDPASYKIVDHFRVGRQPQHVTPSYDLKTLWVLNDLGDSETKIDPATGKKGKTVRVEDPYNMYYTPDGKFAIVVAERKYRLDFVNPQTMKLAHALSVPCRGVDHMDFSADGRYLIASCEFSSSLVKVDVAKQSLLGS